MAVKKTESTTKTKATPAKKEVKSAEKTSEVKTEIKAEAKEVKEPVKKTTTRKASEKPAAEKTEEVKAETVKKETVKKETVKKAKAAPEVEAAVHFEFSGKSYTPEDLVKICKDVWKYDLNGKEEELGSVELYVKPEENVVYYVINGSVQGSFNI